MEEIEPNMFQYWNDEEEEEVATQEEFDRASVFTSAPDCIGGHCGCYYTNCNVCCRCGNVHLRNISPVRESMPMEREWKKPKRLDPIYEGWVTPQVNGEGGNSWITPQFEASKDDDIV